MLKQIKLTHNQANQNLILACENGHDKVLIFLENNDILVNHSDNFGKTPLSRACQKGRDIVVKLLLKRDDIRVNQEDWTGSTPLFREAQKRRGKTHLPASPTAICSGRTQNPHRIQEHRELGTKQYGYRRTHMKLDKYLHLYF